MNGYLRRGSEVELKSLSGAAAADRGYAIGSLIAQLIDHTIFGGKPREGPRLTELDIQTSSYGSEIPAIFGAMRVVGMVILATDFIERRNKSKCGKGRPFPISWTERKRVIKSV